MGETNQSASQKQRNEMWGGRFAEGPSAIMRAINNSLSFDKRLAIEDVEGSLAHAAMLGECGIIAKEDVQAITKGLKAIEQELMAGTFPFREDYEDIHMNIEKRLQELIGEPALRLHTARSRNDQAATDTRLWLRKQIDGQLGALLAYEKALLAQADRHFDLPMPGYTHLQMAQPVSFGHHLMAYQAMGERDYQRLAAARSTVNQSPLGAAALAGTPYPINREHTAKALGFERVLANSMDAVGSRDFILEYLCAIAISAVNFSRLADEIVLWSNDRFGFIRLPDNLSTGSSIMPQKRNPDAAELVRAKAARLWGAVQTMAMVTKALPLTYSKDLQEDKESLFEAVDQFNLILAAMTAMVEGLIPNKDRLRAGLSQGFPTATDLADWLVRNLGKPFREAHHITGSLVKLAEQKGLDISELSLADMQSIEPLINASVFQALTIEASLNARQSQGGTAPARVKEAIAAARISWQARQDLRKEL